MRKLSIIFLFFSFTRSGAQSPDTAINNFYFQKDNLLQVYYSLRDSSSLYNGRQFYGYSQSIEGDAFYPLNSISRGDILYDNAWYRGVEMMYDAYKDELIARHPVPFEIDLVLFREKIAEFVLIGKVFVYIRKDKDEVMTSGFYQKLTSGNAVFLVKRTKQLEEKIYGTRIESKFLTKDRFYILKDDRYYHVKRENDLVDLFKDKRDEIYAYKHQLKLRFKSDPEYFILKLTNYYNELHK